MEGVSHGSSSVGVALAVAIKECSVELFRNLLPVCRACRLAFDEGREIEVGGIGEDGSGGCARRGEQNKAGEVHCWSEALKGLMGCLDGW